VDRFGGTIWRRDLIAMLGGAAVAWPLAARAQVAPKRIGVLAVDGTRGSASYAAFKTELQRLGWVDGKTAVFDPRFLGSEPDDIRRQAREIVAAAPDVIVAAGSPTLVALRQATSTIPVVFAQVADPVAQGFAASLAHPGGNLTGFAIYEASMAGKWLGLLEEVAPELRRVAVLYDPDVQPQAPLYLQTLDAARAGKSVHVMPAPVKDGADIETAAASIAADRGGGLLVIPGASFGEADRNGVAAVAAAAHHRLPAIYPYAAYARAGGLIGYGTDILDLYIRAAGYVDRILKGEKPADLPVQLPTKFTLAINLKTAKAINLTVPPLLLALADEVIE